MNKSQRNQIQFNWSVVGHRNVLEYLQGVIKNQRIAHAYLFVGPEAVGKTWLAENFMSSLICEHSTKLPCGKCLPCQQLEKKIHSDVHCVAKLPDKNFITVDQIRDLRKKLELASFLNSYKIALIDNAELMNSEASNALLKTLEEPNPDVVVLMTAQDENLVLPTISSRSQIIRLYPVAINEIYDYLISLGAKRGEALKIARLSKGRPGLAITLFKSKEFLREYENKIKELTDFAKNPIFEKFDFIQNDLDFKDKHEMSNLLETLESIFRDLLLIKTQSKELLTNEFLKIKLEELEKEFEVSDLLKMLAGLRKAKTYTKANVDSRLLLENLALGV